jgi:hypothetical protein
VCSVEGKLRLLERACAVGSASEAGEGSGLHGVQAGGECWVMGLPVQEGDAGLRPLEGVPWAILVHRQVAEAGMDVRCQFDVIGHGAESERSTEMSLRQVIVAGVVGHPAGHLRKSGRRIEELLVAVDETGRNLLLKVLDH